MTPTYRRLAALIVTLFVVGAGAIAIGRLGIGRSGDSSLHGRIFMTAGEASNPVFIPLVLDLDAQAVRFPQEDRGGIASFDTFALDGSTRAYVWVSKQVYTDAAKGTGVLGDAFQIHVSSSTDADFVVDAGMRVTNDSSLVKTEPALSPNGKRLAYATRTRVHEDGSVAYRIRIVGSPRLEISGTHPAWLDNDHLLYLAPQGVAVYSLLDKTDTVVLPTPGNPNIKLALSPDRRHLAIADPDAKSVYLMTLKTLEHLEANLSPELTIPTIGYWVVFSPDSRYLAVQSYDTGAQAPSMMFFEVGTGAVASPPITLRGINNDRLFVTAWK